MLLKRSLASQIKFDTIVERFGLVFNRMKHYKTFFPTLGNSSSNPLEKNRQNCMFG